MNYVGCNIPEDTGVDYIYFKHPVSYDAHRNKHWHNSESPEAM